MPRSLSYQLTAADAHMRTAIGTREDEAIHINETDRGVALYGPYVPLPPGTYTAKLQFRRDRACRGSAVIDVCVESGNRILGRKTISETSIAEDGTAGIEFFCTDTFADVEVRLISDGGFVADIEGLEITGELAHAYPKVEMADLPTVPIKNVPSRGRSLYDGYQRGVGLQFTDLPRKIFRDPDFNEARELAGRRTILSDVVLCNMFLILKLYLPHLPSGNIVEFGSYMGGGAIYMAALARKFLPACRVFAFDTFSGMPTTDSRVDHHQAGAFAGVDLPELRSYVDEIGVHNLEFVQGDFADTATAKLQQIRSVSFCHIDCDIRSAIECVYDATKPQMVSGGYWILDDPMVSDCLGAAEAMEDLLIRRDRLNSEQVFPHYVFRQP